MSDEDVSDIRETGIAIDSDRKMFLHLPQPCIYVPTPGFSWLGDPPSGFSAYLDDYLDERLTTTYWSYPILFTTAHKTLPGTAAQLNEWRPAAYANLQRHMTARATPATGGRVETPPRSILATTAVSQRDYLRPGTAQ